MFDTLQEFLTKSQDSLNQMDLDVISLEKNAQDDKALSSMFAIIHSVKAAARAHGLTTIELVAHAGEGLLDRLRSGEVVPDKDKVGLLLELADSLRELMDLVATAEAEEGDYSGLIKRLESNDTLTEAAPVVSSDSDELVGEPVVLELDDEMKEVLKDFLQESYENLDRVDSELIELEGEPDNRELLSSIFRSMHTIKGTCGFFGFDKLEKVTHVGENLLVKLRDGKYSMSEDIANGLLLMVDAVRDMLGEISENGHDGRKLYGALIERLSELKDNGGIAKEAVVVVNDDIEVGAGAHVFSAEPEPVKPEPSQAAPVAAVPAPATATTETTPAEPSREKSGGMVVEASIRVDVPVLDALMNLVGELVLARNQIVEYIGSHENTQMVAAAQRLNLITSELQEGVMQTRMQPIHSIWAKLPRVVRDLSRSCGKQIRVEMEGKSTELDKSLIEAMKDPITHLVRNSVDHGVETPEQRVAAGKPAEGVLLLRAFHEGGQVHIEISDDGAGIPPERIRDKAIENGVITAEQGASMSDQEICKLIFLPGLSTAEKVTNISGRGVGMDVVKTNIEKISGTIDLDSVVGRGTTFKIRVPLTLAIVPALIVTTGAQRFAIPQVNLIELIRIDEEAQSRAIEYIHGCPVHRLRGQLLPLVYLHKELRLKTPEPGALNIVVLQADKCRFGLVVDQINDTQEIVVKPLAEALKNIPVFAGATIMGDGRVALILDALGIGQRARVMSDSPNRAANLTTGNNSEKTGKSETLLLVSTSSNGRLAIPLNRVARLEQFDTKQTEAVGGASVVQYRGQILPLVKLSDFLLERRSGRDGEVADKELIQVVVFGDEGRQVGLIVSEIIDVVDEVLTTRGKTSRVGVLGTAAIHGQVTELFDVSEFIKSTADLIVELREAV
ncbi:chemotaxis protein CheA [Granulosicoccus antarcticus]|uniref:Chemotaxis protein CheA n=1 Tax=Granulosicoccus antarcticus IMCC3135 TaxID=1192854 RepID=A0A2Z2NIT4_9GAMM|nr:chemotaxis protein CheA [Granulosicoccus antarcticus]ASJ70395.1 Chemotaxis protein CheA [Granulosicoccus antarcticus IMCC3135]